MKTPKKKKLVILLSIALALVLVVATTVIGVCVTRVNASANIPSHWEYWWSATRPNTDAYAITRNASTNGESFQLDGIQYFQEFYPVTDVYDYISLYLKEGYGVAPGFSHPVVYANGVILEYDGFDPWAGQYNYYIILSDTTHIEYTVTGIVDSNGIPIDQPEPITCPCCSTV